MGILIPLLLILFTCLVIWRACDGFEIASEYLGRNLSEGVRGGTINAVSSSMPEFLTTLIALFLLADEDGFAIGLGTTAGSALFNGMIIPAACILTVVGSVIAGVRVGSVHVSSKVILRDGITLMLCEALLVVLINANQLHWWHGLVLVLIYVSYVVGMVWSMKANVRTLQASRDMDDREGSSGEGEAAYEPAAKATPGAWGKIVYWTTGGPLLDLERVFVREHHRQQMRSETWNAWPLLISSITLIGIACWLLVLACEWLGTGPTNKMHPSYELLGYRLHGIGMPAMFVAVIFASMATSVPDTVMSIRDARDGDYDDAVANALGSNIFDICFALGFPVLAYTIFRGPIEMAPLVAAQSGELLLLLLFITMAGFCVYYFGPRGGTEHGASVIHLGRGSALLLILLYIAFVVYIVGRSQDAAWTQGLSHGLQFLLNQLPRLS